MSASSALLTGAAVAVGLPGAATALHLGVLGVGSLMYRSPAPRPAGRTLSLLVLIPAHNEEKVIGEALAAVVADLRPQDRVLVVADRCTDSTAEIASAAGAMVFEREPDAVPGRAAARQDGVAFAMRLNWDALVMIDADSVIEPGFLDAVEEALASGADALQARSEAALGSRLVDQVTVASFALQGLLIPRGRDRLGLLVRMRGTGMVLSRRVVSRFEFRAAASEDLWYSLDLLMAGIRPRHLERARLRSLNVGSWRAAGSQKLRYEAGRMGAARAFAGPLLRLHNAASLEAACFLLTPPFAIAGLLLACSIPLAVLAGAPPVAIGLSAALGLLVADLGLALIQAGAGVRTWAALAIAPWYLPWKAVVQIKAAAGLLRGSQSYGATPR